MSQRRGCAAALGAAFLLLGAAACGGDDEPSSTEPVVVEIAFSDDGVAPVGERIEVEAGQPVDLEVTADQAGEIHVHSEPEQELAYDAGSTTFELAFDRPGVVAVESHDLGQVIVQFEVQ